MTAETAVAGTFRDRARGELEALRRAVLDQRDWYPEPEWSHRMTASVAALTADVGPLRTAIAETGLVEVALDRVPTVTEFIALGERLGRPMAETAPAVQPFVEHGVVLNVVAEHQRTNDLDIQPFSDTALTLHTETSGKPLQEQPRYLVFSCLHAPPPGAGAQTLVVPAAAVLARLSPAVQAILRHTRYAGPSCPPLLSDLDGRPVLSFRDFRGQDLEWVHSGPAVGGEEVAGALAALTAAMYHPDAVRGIHWRPRSLLVLDNSRGFHGRSVGDTSAHGPFRRHLQRLRIVAG